MLQLSGSDSFIGFLGLQSPKVSINSSPSVLLPTPEFFMTPCSYEAQVTVSIAGKQPSCFLVPQKSRARLPKIVSVNYDSLCPTHTHTPSLLSFYFMVQLPKTELFNYIECMAGQRMLL